MCERASDQVRSVVDDLDVHTGRQGRADFLQSFLGRFDDKARVLAAQHHDHAGDDFPAAIPRDNALTCERSNPHRSDIAHQHRNSCGSAADNDLFDILRGPQQRLASDKSLFTIMHDIATAGIHICAVECVNHVGHRQTEVGQAIRVHLHFKGLVEAAVRIDFRHTGGLAQTRCDLPVENSPQLHRRLLPATNLELQDFAQRRRQRADFRISIIADRGFGRGQSLLHQIARVVDVRSLMKNNRHQGQAQLRDTPHLFDIRQTTHRRFHRIRDVALNFQRGERTGFRNHLHLDIRHVRHGVDRNRHGRVDAGDGDEQHEDDDHQLIVQTEVDQSGQHGSSDLFGLVFQQKFRLQRNAP